MDMMRNDRSAVRISPRHPSRCPGHGSIKRSVTNINADADAVDDNADAEPMPVQMLTPASGRGCKPSRPATLLCLNQAAQFLGNFARRPPSLARRSDSTACPQTFTLDSVGKPSSMPQRCAVLGRLIYCLHLPSNQQAPFRSVEGQGTVSRRKQEVVTGSKQCLA